MQDISRGQERTRIWPEPRGAPKTKADRDRQEQFRVVQKLISYFAPGMLAYIYKATKNSPLLVRDVGTMLLFGRWLAFELTDGRTLHPMPAIQDVSEALDVLGKTIGDYLVRTAEGWRAVSALPDPPGTKKQGWAYRSGNVAGIAGGFARVPFNAVKGSAPGSWWKGAPDYAWRPDTPGFYFVEVSIRKTAENINTCDARIVGLSPVVRSEDKASMRQVVACGMVYLDGSQDLTTGGFNASGGTIEGGSDTHTYFRITGPF